TVLHVRAPGEDDVTDRRQFEARGLKFFSLEVPIPLTREVVEEFNHMIGDPGNQPLFVYDRDGILAGGMWYLHIRIAAGARGGGEDEGGAIGLEGRPERRGQAHVAGHPAIPGRQQTVRARVERGRLQGYLIPSSTRNPTARIRASALLCRTTPGCSR